ncbi:hypothetical protein GDO81_030149 [Engystomops pustulosus]|uniref:Uncharacterized protein n=1 Tax=Engystomops pustulosus TaxID=76066 RepID=A0AAV6YB72_ENGPU|nr:hypothetical protein GDO81_030149 [Engystomops pustulosus]
MSGAGTIGEQMGLHFIRGRNRSVTNSKWLIAPLPGTRRRSITKSHSSVVEKLQAKNTRRHHQEQRNNENTLSFIYTPDVGRKMAADGDSGEHFTRQGEAMASRIYMTVKRLRNISRDKFPRWKR